MQRGSQSEAVRIEESAHRSGGNMRRAVGLGVLLLGLFISVWADSGEKEKDRLKESGNVLKEILGAPDKGIPGSVLNGSKCVIIFPSVKKAAVGIGGNYGRGVMTCRQ